MSYNSGTMTTGVTPFQWTVEGCLMHHLVLPEPTATLDLTMDDGAPIRLVRHGNPSGPRVVLSPEPALRAIPTSRSGG